MLATFDFAVDYGQIVVDLAGPRPDPHLWSSPNETDQGFSWAPGAVAFAVPDLDGNCRVVVATVARVAVDADALWALRVPFHVPPLGEVEVGTVADPRRVAVPSGDYSVVFEALPGTTTNPLVLHVTFVVDPKPDWAILKRGGEVATDRVLKRRAGPA